MNMPISMTSYQYFVCVLYVQQSYQYRRLISIFAKQNADAVARLSLYRADLCILNTFKVILVWSNHDTITVITKRFNA